MVSLELVVEKSFMILSLCSSIVSIPAIIRRTGVSNSSNTGFGADPEGSNCTY